MPFKEWSEPVQCVVEEMFMVNSVEFASFDHINGICKFEDCHAGRLKKTREPSHKIINVINVRHDVVRNNDVGKFAFTCQSLGALRPEEIVYCRHSNGICPGYWPVGRIDAETTNPSLDKITQQIPVITGNLDDKLCEPSVYLSTSAATCSAECFSSAGEDDEKYG